MANSDKSIFHWVDQYQLMPVWQDYPPPFTAYESYYLERDRQKYYLGCLTDNRDVVYDSHYHRHHNNHNHHHRINPLPLFPNTEGHCTTTTITDLKPSALIRDPEFSTTSFLANHHSSSSSSYNSSPTDDVSIKESPQPKIRLYPNPSSSARLRLLPSGAPESSSFESASDFSQEENREEESEDVEISEDETTTTSEVYGSLKRRNNYDLSTINEVSQPRKRQRTTPEQLEVLEKVYENEKLPNSDLRKELAVQLGMTPRRVQVWFQNKRAKEKRMTFSK
jgi:hypothetical protein